MNWLKNISALIMAFGILVQPVMAENYLGNKDKVKYQLSERVKKELDSSSKLVQRVHRQMFVFIDGTCQNPFVPCHCSFEGFAASCDFVLSCLESGLCVPDN